MYVSLLEIGYLPNQTFFFLRIDHDISNLAMLSDEATEEVITDSPVLAGNLNAVRSLFARISADNGVLPHSLSTSDLRRLLNVESRRQLERNVQKIATKCAKRIAKETETVSRKRTCQQSDFMTSRCFHFSPKTRSPIRCSRPSTPHSSTPLL